MSDAPHTSYMQALEAQSEQKKNVKALMMPGQSEPIGYLEFPEGEELSGIRLCVAGKMYDAVVTGPGEPLYFAIDETQFPSLDTTQS